MYSIYIYVPLLLALKIAIVNGNFLIKQKITNNYKNFNDNEKVKRDLDDKEPDTNQHYLYDQVSGYEESQVDDHQRNVQYDVHEETENNHQALNYEESEEHLGESNYYFKYGVHDPHTGDIKHQFEKKDGDTVTGQYFLVEPDGTLRTVDYVVGKHTGFTAVVKKTLPEENH